MRFPGGAELSACRKPPPPLSCFSNFLRTSGGLCYIADGKYILPEVLYFWI
jgi:hypothetical protein